MLSLSAFRIAWRFKFALHFVSVRSPVGKSDCPVCELLMERLPTRLKRKRRIMFQFLSSDSVQQLSLMYYFRNIPKYLEFISDNFSFFLLLFSSNPFGLGDMLICTTKLIPTGDYKSWISQDNHYVAYGLPHLYNIILNNEYMYFSKPFIWMTNRGEVFHYSVVDEQDLHLRFHNNCLFASQ